MKATDLMIGDWVLMDMNFSEENPIYTQPDYRHYQIKNGEDINLACETNCLGDADVYLPIQLTPEILEKNGFESIITIFDGLTYQYASKNEECRVRVLVNDKNIATGIEIDSKVCWLYCDCSFVHELQHTLKLCGIKKGIEL